MLTGTLITGLGLGSMYGLIALGFHITYAVSGTVNFAQGSAVTLGRRAGLHLRRHARLADAAGDPRGARWAARSSASWSSGCWCGPSSRRGSDAWLLATVAGGIVLDNAMLFTFGKEPRSLPSRSR